VQKKGDEGADQDVGGEVGDSAGGFLTGVGDVVQHYTLPQPTHVVFSSPPRSPGPDNSKQKPVPDPVLSLPLLDEADGDSAGEGGDAEQKGSDSDDQCDHHPANEEESPGRGMPKSMAELAAEAEAAAIAQMSREELDMGEVQEGVVPAGRRHRRAPPRARPKVSGQRRTERPRSRKRTREIDEGEDDEWVGGDGGVEGEEDAASEDDGRRRGAKRARTRASRGTSPAAPAPVPIPDRVLRSRKK